jgi:hypothetical protein
MHQMPPRQVKMLYWELFNTSEIWVSLIPASSPDSQRHVRLVFQAYWPGKDVSRPANRIVLRALPLPLTVVTQYSLRLKIDEENIELAGGCESPSRPAPPCLLLYPPGENTSANGVAVDLETRVLRRLAGAKEVTGVALGFPVIFAPQDLTAVQQFVDAAHLKQ